MEKKELTNEEFWQDYQAYMAERYKNIDIKRDNVKGQDKIIITISSALFGIVLTMFDKDTFASSEVARLFLLLLLITNSVTLIVGLLSFYFGNKAIDKNIEMLDMQIECREYDDKNCWRNIASYCNNTCLATTCLTVIILSVMIAFKLF